MAPNGGTSSKTSFPPEFRMDPIFYSLLSCELTKDQWIQICRYRIAYLKACADEEAKMYDNMLKTLG